MATPAFTHNQDLPGNSHEFVWDLTTADHTGVACEIPGAPDKCGQFVGSNWGGATAGWEGSNDGVVFAPITEVDLTATASTSDATGLQTLLDNPRYIRPRLTTVGTAAVVKARLFCRSTMR